MERTSNNTDGTPYVCVCFEIESILLERHVTADRTRFVHRGVAIPKVQHSVLQIALHRCGGGSEEEGQEGQRKTSFFIFVPQM